jgi:hypothetical protein
MPATATAAGAHRSQGARHRPGRPAWNRSDWLLVALLLTGVVVVEFWLRALSTRPLWYDELWRAHYLSVPRSQFWHEITRANAPSAAGWIFLERATADTFGWTPLVLRLPELITLPLVGVSMYALTRHFTGRIVAFATGVLVGLSGTVLDLGWQLKPYTIELIVAVAVMLLWMRAPAPGSGSARARIGLRTVAGALTIFTVPLAFLLVPLAVADVVMASGWRRGGWRQGWRTRWRAAWETAPAIAIVGAHSLFFIARQSSQRNGAYWNSSFVPHHFGAAVRFIWDKIVAIIGTTPPGVDRIDVNVVHPATNNGWEGTWLIAPGFAIAFLVGASVLRRSRDGRLVLWGALGGELLILLASADRYWPFGPSRTNLFLVPLLTVVPAVGIGRLVRAARRHWLVLTPALALIGVAGLAVGSALWTVHALADRRGHHRLIDRLPQATDQLRLATRPGDVIVIPGPEVRAGFIYSTTVRKGIPAGLPALAPTIFVSSGGDGTASRALRAHPPASGRVLLFDLVIERYQERPELAELHRVGWCTVTPPQLLARTARLTVLEACTR